MTQPVNKCWWIYWSYYTYFKSSLFDDKSCSIGCCFYRTSSLSLIFGCAVKRTDLIYFFFFFLTITLLCPPSLPGWVEASEEGRTFLLQNLSVLFVSGSDRDKRPGKNVIFCDNSVIMLFLNWRPRLKYYLNTKTNIKKMYLLLWKFVASS